MPSALGWSDPWRRRTSKQGEGYTSLLNQGFGTEGHIRTRFRPHYGGPGDEKDIPPQASSGSEPLHVKGSESQLRP